MVMEQVASKAWLDHDPLTRYLMTKIGGDIDRRSKGEPASEALEREVEILSHSPLNEAPGEGFHRGTHCEKLRAPASSDIHLKQTNRRREVLKRMMAFKKKHGAKGKAVIRHEWRNWTRILRQSPRRRFMAKKISAKAAYARIFREDERALDDWSAICSRVALEGAVVSDIVSAKDACRNELLRSILSKGKHYSLSQDVTDTALDGARVPRRVVKHFHLLNFAIGNSRPKFMHSVQSSDSVSQIASLALQVVTEDVREPAEGGPTESGVSDVSIDGEPTWVRPEALAPNDTWYRRLYVWRAGISVVEGCTRLYDRQRCMNTTPLLDSACPTLPIAWSLKDAGWTSTQRKCIHDTSVVGMFDHTEAVKMKFYFQTLLCIGRCLGLTSRIPSRQPVYFYRDLLAGIRVEPGLKSKEYLALWKNTGVRR